MWVHFYTSTSVIVAHQHQVNDYVTNFILVAQLVQQQDKMVEILSLLVTQRDQPNLSQPTWSTQPLNTIPEQVLPQPSDSSLSLPSGYTSHSGPSCFPTRLSYAQVSPSQSQAPSSGQSRSYAPLSGSTLVLHSGQILASPSSSTLAQLSDQTLASPSNQPPPTPTLALPSSRHLFHSLISHLLHITVYHVNLHPLFR